MMRSFAGDAAACLNIISDDLRAILYRGVPLLHYSHNHRQAEAFAIASLAIAVLAKATDLARAFNKSRNAAAAYKRRMEQRGTAALLRLRRGPKGAHKAKPSIERVILKLKSKGMANARIASRPGLSDMTVARTTFQRRLLSERRNRTER